jgi:hypothetical protein
VTLHAQTNHRVDLCHGVIDCTNFKSVEADGCRVQRGIVVGRVSLVSSSDGYSVAVAQSAALSCQSSRLKFIRAQIRPRCCDQERSAILFRMLRPRHTRQLLPGQAVVYAQPGTHRGQTVGSTDGNHPREQSVWGCVLRVDRAPKYAKNGLVALFLKKPCAYPRRNQPNAQRALNRSPSVPGIIVLMCRLVA